MAKPMADYLSSVTADYATETLDIPCHEVLVQTAKKEQFVHRFSDGQRGTVTLSNTSFFTVKLRWKGLTSTNAGIIADFWNSTTKGNGLARSFYWSHPRDGNDYTVKFAEPLGQEWVEDDPNRSNVKEIVLDVWGTKP